MLNPFVTKRMGPNNKGGKRVCTHCGKNGHTVDVCYRKHAFPPTGHKTFSTKAKSNEPKNDEDDQEVKFTQQQYQALMALIKPGGDSDNTTHKQSHVGSISSNTVEPGNIFNCCSFFHNNEKWIIDSGATDHVAINLDSFTSYKRINHIKINLPNGTCINATHKADIKLNNGIMLHNVLFIPDFNYNLISISKLVVDSQVHVVFTNSDCLIQNQVSKKMIGSVSFHEGLYVLSDSKNSVNSACSNTWHRRLGHLSDQRLHILKSKHDYIDIRNEHCDVCHMAKQKKLSFSNSQSRADKCFNLIHVDIWGPAPTPSLHGHRYFLTVIDNFSRYSWIYLMHNKSETRTHLTNFINFVENQFETKVKVIRSDNGHEFKMNEFFSSKGIIHQTSCVETPEQNGIAERKHQHLLNVTRALLSQSKISTHFWSYALTRAAFLINITPTPFLQNSTPYEKLHGDSYNFKNLKVFGCLCYMQTISAKRSKFDPRAKPGIFLGFPSNTKGYIVFDLKHHDIKVSRNVLFYEDVFPSCINIDDSAVSKTDICLPVNQSYNYTFDQLNNAYSDIVGVEQSDISEQINTYAHSEIITQVNNPEQSSTVDISHRRSHRTKNIPAYLKDYHTDLACVKSSKYPIQSYVSLSRLSSHFQQVTLNIDSHSEPKSFNEVVQDSNWRDAMDTELKALEQNKTWTLVKLPTNCSSIGCKWVYKLKHKADGSIERYKARLVAKGFTQLEGMDFHDTFALVARLTTVRMILAVAAIKNWQLIQLDVNNAFWHGELDETIYMDMPPGMTKTDPQQVCLLHKSLYGLRQASRQWYAQLSSFLLSHNFKQSSADHSLFIHNNQGKITLLLVYVDDIIVTGDNVENTHRITALLDQRFKLKNLRNLNYFLGFEIARGNKGIILSQRKYTIDLLSEIGMLNCSPVSTPMNFSIKYHADGEALPDPTTYRRLIGKAFLYLGVVLNSNL